ncbi:hypothetical protein BH11PSE8_BH11PSE8_26650 [soil metagenome]
MTTRMAYWWKQWLGAFAIASFCSIAAVPVHAQDAASLRARQAALKDQLANNQFQRPLYLESEQTSGDLKGDVYALLDQPYAVVGQALQGMDHWCDVLILHLNVKHCRAASTGGNDVLSLSVGRKFDQPLSDAYLVDFAYKVLAATPEFLRVSLSADKGPMGTSNYRIVLEAIPLDAKHSFIHMSYSYAYGVAARLAMQGYLATIGSDKVGFSIVEKKPDGKPVYVGGVRGVVERNTMRYYLAIESYVNAFTLPASEQAQKRLESWHDGVERYPVQLHELERAEYMDMKHKEIARQQASAKAPAAK